MSHIVWPRLPSFALKVRVARAVIEAGEPLESFTSSGPGREVWGALARVCSGVLSMDRALRSDQEAADQGPAIELFFDKVAAELQAQCTSAADQSPAAQRLLELLVWSCSERVCGTCVSNPCRWTQSSRSGDSQLQDSSGLCVRPVAELFDHARAVGQDAYASASADSSTAKRLRFATTFDFVRNEPLDVSINANTDEGTDSLGGFRAVQASFFIEQFSVDDYLALYYVLVHECLVHGFCGVRKVRSSEKWMSEAFHEGWMDAIAWEIAARAMHKTDSRQSFVGRHSLEFLRIGTRTRDTRRNSSRPGADPNVAEWVIGARTCDAFLWLITLVISEEDAPWDVVSAAAFRQLCKFSLAVNGSTLEHKERGDLVEAIYERYGRIPPGGRPLRAGFARDVASVRDFIGGSVDALSLVEILVATP